LRRVKNYIRRAVSEAVRDRSIKDIQNTQSITIPRKDIAEPSFRHGPGGRREMVHPGNSDYIRGDKIQRPQGGGGGGGGSQASNEGEGQDDFVFELSREEFMQYFFDDLELPRLVKTHLLAVPTWKSIRAGWAAEGTPNNIDVVRSLRSALGRRIALGAPLVNQLHEMERQLEALKADPDDRRDEIKLLEEEIHHLRGRIWRIPFIDPFDLRYVNRVKQPTPSSQAGMFCLMDVSPGPWTSSAKTSPSAFSSFCTSFSSATTSVSRWCSYATIRVPRKWTKTPSSIRRKAAARSSPAHWN